LDNLCTLIKYWRRLSKLETSYREVYKTWMNNAKKYFWGDPLDFRFIIVEILRKKYAKKVCDIGCSAGIILNFFESPMKVGIDIDFMALKIGKKIYPEIQFVSASADSLPFKENTFDQINSVLTLDSESVNQKETVKEISRVCTKSGGIYLTGDYFDQKYNKEDKSRKYGYWIDLLKEDFDLKVKGYRKPQMSGINAKLKKGLLIKIPDFMFKMIRPDKMLKNSYVEYQKPIFGNPYTVEGLKK